MVMLSKASGPPSLKAVTAAHIAVASYRDMVKCNEIQPDDYSADDILGAAKLILGWSED
jgi:hypothetical protein